MFFAPENIEIYAPISLYFVHGEGMLKLILVITGKFYRFCWRRDKKIPAPAKTDGRDFIVTCDVLKWY